MNTLTAPVIWLVIVVAQSPPEVAALLERAKHSGPRTSEVDWVLERHQGVDSGLVERFKTETASGAILEDNFGDEQGFHELKFRGGVPQLAHEMTREELLQRAWPLEVDAGTRRTLAMDQEVLVTPIVERPLSGRIGRAGRHDGRRPVDFETISFAPMLLAESNNVFGVHDVWLEDFESAAVRESSFGGKRTVSADFGSDNALRWFSTTGLVIDPFGQSFGFKGTCDMRLRHSTKQLAVGLFPRP